MGKGNTKKKSTGSAYEDEFPVTLEGFGYKFDKGCLSLLLCDIVINQILHSYTNQSTLTSYKGLCD